MARPTRNQRLILERLIAKYEPALAQAFLDAAALIIDAADFDALIRALEAGDIEAAINSLNIRGASFRPLDLAISTAFEAGGVAIIASLPSIRNRAGVRVNLSFDIRNMKAEARLRNHITGRIQGFTEQLERTAREVLTDGLSRGLNPRQTATRLLGAKDASGKRVGGMLTLNDEQTKWALNARRELEEGGRGNLNRYLSRTVRDKRYDAMVRKAIETDTPLTPDQIDKISRRYSDRLLRSRAETISRTETMEALNSAKMAAYQQMEDETGANASLTAKRWVSTHDSRTRHQHAEMSGVEVIGIDTPFTMPDGSPMQHPGDSSLGAGPHQTINCRCYFSVRLNYRGTLE